MSEIIEELAKQYAEDMCPAEYYIDDVNDEERNFDMSVCFDDAESILRWLFNKPLDSRLTEAEKIRMRNIYKGLTECIERNTSDVEYLKGKRTQLVIIFGEEFFKEDKL